MVRETVRSEATSSTAVALRYGANASASSRPKPAAVTVRRRNTPAARPTYGRRSFGFRRAARTVLGVVRLGVGKLDPLRCRRGRTRALDHARNVVQTGNQMERRSTRPVSYTHLRAHE